MHSPKKCSETTITVVYSRVVTKDCSRDLSLRQKLNTRDCLAAGDMNLLSRDLDLVDLVQIFLNPDSKMFVIYPVPQPIWQESVACFTTALRGHGLSAMNRKALADNVDFYNKRVRDIEGELALEELEDLLPDAPTTAPVAPSKSSNARSSGPNGAAPFNPGQGGPLRVLFGQ